MASRRRSHGRHRRAVGHRLRLIVACKRSAAAIWGRRADSKQLISITLMQLTYENRARRRLGWGRLFQAAGLDARHRGRWRFSHAPMTTVDCAHTIESYTTDTNIKQNEAVTVWDTSYVGALFSWRSFGEVENSITCANVAAKAFLASYTRTPYHHLFVEKKDCK